MSTRSFFGGGIGREIACFSPRELTDFHAMQKIQVKVTNALGVHARPSAKIAHLASRFTCSVWIAVKGRWGQCTQYRRCHVARCGGRQHDHHRNERP